MSDDILKLLLTALFGLVSLIVGAVVTARLGERQKRAEGERQSKEDRIDEYRDDVKALREAVERRDVRIEALIAERDQKLAELRADVDRLREERIDLKTEVMTLTRQLATERTTNAGLIAQGQRQDEELVHLRAQVATLQERQGGH